jgi:DNA-binding MarR family transcriptional regulator
MDADQVRPPSLLELPSYVAGNVARTGHRLLLEALAHHDLRLAHFALLGALADFGPLAQRELAERLDLNQSHLVGYVDDIEGRGLVRRDRDPEDRRRQRVALTPAGRALLGELQEVARRSQAEFLQALSEPERRTLIELLRRVLLANDEARLNAKLTP